MRFAIRLLSNVKVGLASTAKTHAGLTNTKTVCIEVHVRERQRIVAPSGGLLLLAADPELGHSSPVRIL